MAGQQSHGQERRKTVFQNFVISHLNRILFPDKADMRAVGIIKNKTESRITITGLPDTAHIDDIFSGGSIQFYFIRSQNPLFVGKYYRNMGMTDKTDSLFNLFHILFGFIFGKYVVPLFRMGWGTVYIENFILMM
jgi:hypothetical protein